MKENLTYLKFRRRGGTQMRIALCALTVLFAATCIAQADTVYTSQAAWNAAVSGVSTINFEGIANPTCTPATVPACGFANETPSFVQGGDTFGIGPSAPGGSVLYVIGDDYYGYGYATVSSQAGSGTLDLEVTLPSPVTAFAFDYIVGTGPVTITASDGLNQTEPAPGAGNNYLFFGVTDPGGITSLDITQAYTAASQAINMKDFSSATANPATVPEPSSLLVSSALLTGLLGLVRRRRQSKSIS
jgi:hypothetical protein